MNSHKELEEKERIGKESRKETAVSKSRDKRSASMDSVIVPGKKGFARDDSFTETYPSSSSSLAKLPSQESLNSSTALSFKAYQHEPGSTTSSDQGSPGRDKTSPGRELTPISEERRRRQSGSPRRAFLISSNKNGSPRDGTGTKTPISSANSSPRSASSSSPRILQKSTGSTHLPKIVSEEGIVLPVAKEEVSALVTAAQMRYHGRLDPENLKREHKELNKELKDEEAVALANLNRVNGYTYTHAPAGGAKKYPIIVTGNIPFGVRVFLVDFAAKLGEGAKGTTYVGYMLQPEEKVAIKFVDDVGSEDILREASNLFVVGDFMGLYRGPFELPHETEEREQKEREAREGKEEEKEDGRDKKKIKVKTKNKVALIMRLAPGQLLGEHLYQTNKELKIHRDYKDRVDYYGAKQRFSYNDVMDISAAVIDALAVLHDAWLLHRDISCDNILIAKTVSGYKARYIDFDAAAKIGCELVHVSLMPEKQSLIKLGLIESIINRASATYIRYGDQLFYLHRDRNILHEIRIPRELLEYFDKELKPDSSARMLSQEELKTITTITGHAHFFPRYTGLNVAYCFAAPEFSRRPKIFSFQSDFYMLGALLVFILGDSNVMQKSNEEFAKMMLRTNYHREELPAEKLKEMAPDIFTAFHYNSTRHSLNDFVYHSFIVPVLRARLDNLLADDPTMRLFGSSLRELAAQFTDLRKQLNKLSEGLSILMDGLSSIQNVGVLLSEVLTIIKEFSQHQAKQDYFLKAIDQLLNLHTSGVDDSADTILLTLERVGKQEQKRLNLWSSLNKVLKGWNILKSDMPPIEQLKPLIFALCPNGTETVKFLQKLPSAWAAAFEKQGQKAEPHISNVLK